VPDLEDVDDIVIDGPVISISLKNDSKVTTALMKKLNINPDAPPTMPKFIDGKETKNLKPVLIAPLASIKELKKKEPVLSVAPAVANASSKAKSKKDKKKLKKAAELERAAVLAAAEVKKKNQKGSKQTAVVDVARQSATKLDEFFSLDEEFSETDEKGKQASDVKNKVEAFFELIGHFLIEN